ncbi:MAG: ABC transporter permease, partial [Alicyclobacillus sp.]|nr:ABC transporter permease [Alicyclobacillus sp.]
LIFGLFATAVMFVCTVLVGWIFFGTSGAFLPHYFVNAHHSVQQMSSVAFLLMQYGFLLIQIVITATIAFMISAIFRSSALAITISLLAFVVGNTIVHALSSYHWVKYILFANTDLSQYVVNGPQIQGLTLGFSITMLIAYFVVMMALAWAVFLKRDVAYT